MFVFKTAGREIATAQSQVRPQVERVGSAVVDAHEGEISERIEGRKLWIDPRAVVVTTARADVLIGNRIRKLIVYLLR